MVIHDHHRPIKEESLLTQPTRMEAKVNPFNPTLNPSLEHPTLVHITQALRIRSASTPAGTKFRGQVHTQCTPRGGVPWSLASFFLFAQCLDCRTRYTSTQLQSYTQDAVNNQSGPLLLGLRMILIERQATRKHSVVQNCMHEMP